MEDSMLKAILFDMDGVIIDSEPLHAKAAVNAMKKFGITITTDFCYSFIGSTAKHMLEVIKEEWNLSSSIEELMSANEEAKKGTFAAGRLSWHKGYTPADGSAK